MERIGRWTAVVGLALLRGGSRRRRSTGALDVAPYIADARRLQLVLLGGRTGAEVEGHDWEYLLTALGWLHLDHTIGRATQVAGTAVMLAAITWAVVILRRSNASCEIN